MADCLDTQRMTDLRRQSRASDGIGPCNSAENPVKYEKKGVQNMDNKKENLSVNMEYDETQTIPLALHEVHMARSDKRLRNAFIGWALSVVAIVCAFVFLWLQYDYTSSIETSGVYNLVDSQGNVITSDISPDDVIRILETLDNGKGQEGQNP